MTARQDRGVVPSRRCGSAARIRRSVDCSVPAIAVSQSASDSVSKVPPGGPPVLTTRRSSPPRARDRLPRRRRPIGCRQVGDDRHTAEPRRLGLDPLPGPADDRDPRALARQRRGDPAADPRSPTADERPPALQSQVHAMPPMRARPA